MNEANASEGGGGPSGVGGTSAGGMVVCDRCGDTHRVYIEETGRTFACTSCPLPCRRCASNQGRGAFCATTPCGCWCHRSAKHTKMRQAKNKSRHTKGRDFTSAVSSVEVAESQKATCYNGREGDSPMSDIEYDNELAQMVAECVTRGWKWSQVMEALGDAANAQADPYRDNDQEATAEQMEAIASHCHGMARVLHRGRL